MKAEIYTARRGKEGVTGRVHTSPPSVRGRSAVFVRRVSGVMSGWESATVHLCACMQALASGLARLVRLRMYP